MGDKVKEQLKMEEQATMKGEDLSQDMPDKMQEESDPRKDMEKDYSKENHAERMIEQEAKANQMDADLKTIKAALDVANRKGAYTLEEAYVIASASKRLF